MRGITLTAKEHKDLIRLMKREDLPSRRLNRQRLSTTASIATPLVPSLIAVHARAALRGRCP